MKTVLGYANRVLKKWAEHRSLLNRGKKNKGLLKVFRLTPFSVKEVGRDPPGAVSTRPGGLPPDGRPSFVRGTLQLYLPDVGM